MRSLSSLVPALLLVAATAAAYQADLVPANRRLEAQEVAGLVSIDGEDGTTTLAGASPSGNDTPPPRTPGTRVAPSIKRPSFPFPE